MRITGRGAWGPPKDRNEALAVLRRALELDINLIDTAESYGPHVSEELIAEALHPYPKGLVIATKGGFDRTGPGQWVVNCRPERLREEIEGSLRRLRLECIDLWHLERVDDNVPEEEQFGAVAEFQREGKVRHIGLADVRIEQIERARKHFDVVSVQNRYNIEEPEWDEVVDYCERETIAFVPWHPLNLGRLNVSRGEALRWLLARSPVMLPIPGTSKVEHLVKNVAAVA